jgi:hypothetical protein
VDHGARLRGAFVCCGLSRHRTWASNALPLAVFLPFFAPYEVQPFREPFGSGVAIPKGKVPAKSSDVAVVPCLG